MPTKLGIAVAVPAIKAAGGGAGGGLAAGTYVSFTQTATTPLPSDPSWIATTKLTDVGLNDHTTFEQMTGGATVYVHGMVVLAVAGTLQSYTFSHFSGEITGTTARHAPADGLAWTDWDNPYPVPPAAGAQIWRDVARNPADAANKKYFAVTFVDVGFDFVWDVRAGDLRLTSV